MDKCYFCESQDTKYCGICKQYLCEEHRKNYPKRLMAFLKESLK